MTTLTMMKWVELPLKRLEGEEVEEAEELQQLRHQLMEEEEVVEGVGAGILRKEKILPTGEKDVPEGTSGCLSGLIFVINGTLHREEAEDLIKQHGGRVTGSISKKKRLVIPASFQSKGLMRMPWQFISLWNCVQGGELFDRIIQKGHYTEKKAAELTKVIVEACHSLSVMHRDLKPGNFLIVNQKEEEAPLNDRLGIVSIL